MFVLKLSQLNEENWYIFYILLSLLDFSTDKLKIHFKTTLHLLNPEQSDLLFRHSVEVKESTGY